MGWPNPRSSPHMGAMRNAELALMLSPVLLIAAWFLGVRHANYRFFVLLAVLLAAFGAGLFWMGFDRSFTGRYVPARLESGSVVASPLH